MTDREPLTYRAAGVDIDAGNELVQRIKPVVAGTHRPGVMGGIGGFGGLFEMPAGYRKPVLVAATDGVGTKLRLAIESGRHDSIGIDLVAMCVNDVAVLGAEPLFFLDYYATDRLDVDVAATVVTGIAEGCRQAGAALLGGETAEMPGMYGSGDYDLAGFCVGVVEKDGILDGSKVSAGDAILGLGATGPHSNGYSLIRHLLAETGHDLSTMLDGTTLGERLLAPTRIYVRALRELAAQVDLHALAHITGGGLPENLPRVLPADCGAAINGDSWPRDVIFSWLQEQGNIAPAEMYRTFNCGIGMVAVVAEEDVAAALGALAAQDTPAWRIGTVTANDHGIVIS